PGHVAGFGAYGRWRVRPGRCPAYVLCGLSPCHHLAHSSRPSATMPRTESTTKKPFFPLAGKREEANRTTLTHLTQETSLPEDILKAGHGNITFIPTIPRPSSSALPRPLSACRWAACWLQYRRD